MIETYGNIVVADEITDETADVMRVSAPAGAANEIRMQRNDFSLPTVRLKQRSVCQK